MKYLFFLTVLFLGLKAEAVELGILDKAVYEVEVAKSEKELERGLMYVRALDENRGMLFDLRAYERGSVSMWMKNTYIALDMLFIDCNGRIVDIYENAEPLSLARIESKTDFCYVLEINGQEVNKKGIQVGDLAVWPYKK